MEDNFESINECLSDLKNEYNNLINTLSNSVDYNSDHADAISKLNNQIDVVNELEVDLKLIENEVTYSDGINENGDELNYE